jgi:Tfp pilus assembly protein PilN
MTRIDLIPPELVEKHQARRIISVMGIGAGVVFAILVVIYLLTTGQIILANNRVDKIKAQNTQVQAYIAKLKPYDDRKKVLDERQKIIDTITTDQVQWSSILNDISMVVPNDIWLKSIKIDIAPILAAKEQAAGASTKAPAVPITIVGDAFDHAAVARWLVHLGEINQFRDVWLDYATEQALAAGATAGTTATTTTTAASASALSVIEFQTTVKLAKFSDTTGAAK